MFAESAPQVSQQGPGTPTSLLQAPPGQEDLVEQACSQHLGNSARCHDHHPISHSSPRSPSCGRGSESCVCPTWPLLAGLWDFPPVCGVKAHGPGGRGGRGITEAPREARVQTLSPTSPAQGPCRLHPGPRQWAAEGLKGTPEGTEEPSGPDLPAMVSGAFRQA